MVRTLNFLSFKVVVLSAQDIMPASTCATLKFKEDAPGAFVV